jgi:hypothetical protein
MMKMKYIALGMAGLALLFAACDSNNGLDNRELSGKEVSVRIRSMSVSEGGSENLGRAALERESEKISRPIGDGMLLEMSVKREESPLRKTELTPGTHFRVIAVSAGTSNYYSHGDYVYGGTLTPSTDFHVRIGQSYDYVCISHNDATLPDASGYVVGDPLPTSLTVDNTKDLLWCRIAGGGAVTAAGVELDITLNQKLAKVQVTVDCGYNSWNISGVGNGLVTIAAIPLTCTMNWLNGTLSGTATDQGFSFAARTLPYTTTHESNVLRIIPTANNAVLTLWPGAVLRDGKSAIPIGNKPVTFNAPLIAGVSYTVHVRLRTPIWARSNIYWDDTTNPSKPTLTFVPAGSDTSKEGWQGVYFKWGSLAGMNPQGSFTPSTIIYVPDGSDGWTTTTYSPYGYVPFWDNNYGNVLNSSYYGSHRGDICIYLSTATHVVAGNYRLPTAVELGYGQNASASWEDRTDGWVPADTWLGPLLLEGGIANMIGSSTPPDNSFAQNVAMDVLFPASGYYDQTGGTLCYVGSVGTYWSSSCDGTGRPLIMNFNESRIYTGTPDNRNAGLSVRCVLAD